LAVESTGSLPGFDQRLASGFLAEKLGSALLASVFPSCPPCETLRQTFWATPAEESGLFRVAQVEVEAEQDPLLRLQGLEWQPLLRRLSLLLRTRLRLLRPPPTFWPPVESLPQVRKTVLAGNLILMTAVPIVEAGKKGRPTGTVYVLGLKGRVNTVAHGIMVLRSRASTLGRVEAILKVIGRTVNGMA